MARTLEISPENQEFIDFLKKYNIQAQIELNKLGANSELLASISNYIKSKTKGPEITTDPELKKLKNESKDLVKGILEKLQNMGAITEENYRALTISSGKRGGEKTKFELILENSLLTNKSFNARDFTLSLYEQGYITPIEKRIAPEILEQYQKQLSERKEEFNNIQEGLELILKDRKDLNKSDRAALSKFISDFELYREGAAEAPYLETTNQLLKKEIYQKFDILEKLHETPRTNNPFKEHLRGIYAKSVLIDYTDVKASFIHPEDRVTIDEAGSKNLIRAIQKILNQYNGNFSNLRDVARIRHSYTDPDLSLDCSFFDRVLAPKYGFEISIENSDIKAVNSATTKAKEIYKFFPKKENDPQNKREEKFILCEVQHMDERQLKLDKEETHNIFGSIRPFIEGSRGNISLHHVTWGQVAKFYEDEERYFKRYTKPSSTSLKRLFGEMSDGLKEILGDALGELKKIRDDDEYKIALFTPSLSKYLNEPSVKTSHSDSVLAGDKLPFDVVNKDQTFENIRTRIAKGIDALNKIHCVIIAAGYEKAHPVDKAIFCTLMEPHMATDEDRKLLAGCQKDLTDKHREKAKEYINHFDLNGKAKQTLKTAGIQI